MSETQGTYTTTNNTTANNNWVTYDQWTNDTNDNLTPAISWNPYTPYIGGRTNTTPSVPYGTSISIPSVFTTQNGQHKCPHCGNEFLEKDKRTIKYKIDKYYEVYYCCKECAEAEVEKQVADLEKVAEKVEQELMVRRKALLKTKIGDQDIAINSKEGEKDEKI